MQVIACYGYDIMQIWKMGSKKLKFTRIEKNGQCLNECMKLCLQNNCYAHYTWQTALCTSTHPLDLSIKNPRPQFNDIDAKKYDKERIIHVIL